MKQKTEREAAELRAMGTKIREGRIALGLSQTKLSELVGISNKQMWNVEHGKNWLSLPVYLAVGRALGHQAFPLL